MKLLQAMILGVLALVQAHSTFAFGVERFVEGVHYVRFDKAEKTPNTVVEFFSLGCPHCAHLEPELEKWLATKPASVTFARIPATWNPRFEFLARVFFALQASGQDKKLVPPLFDYLHKDQKPLANVDEAVAFVKAQGGDAEGFRKAFEAGERTAELQKSESLFMAYEMRGVPAILVNGQYTVSVSQAGGEAELFEIVTFLLTK